MENKIQKQKLVVSWAMVGMLEDFMKMKRRTQEFGIRAMKAELRGETR